MEPKKEHPSYRKTAVGSPGREAVWMNYKVDGQMDFSDFPEILPGESGGGAYGDDFI